MVLFLVEPRSAGREDARGHARATVPSSSGSRRSKKPVLLVINKVDTVPKPLLLPLIDVSAASSPFAEVLPVSAPDGDGRGGALRGRARPAARRGQPLFDAEMLTDQQERAGRRVHPRAGAAPLPAGGPVLRGGGGGRLRRDRARAAPGQQARAGSQGWSGSHATHLRGAGQPEGHRHRQARGDAEDDRHRRAQVHRAPAGHPRVPGPPGEGGAALDRERARAQEAGATR